MSLAGIRSNRGDGFQTLVALDWALTIIADAQYQCLEVDSVRYLVDDVVVSKADGTLICCQCKKNQPDFRYWSVADLREELQKAAKLLENQPHASVCFYSRGLFGDIAKLREHATKYSDAQSFDATLDAGQRATERALRACIEAESRLGCHEFLRRTTFEPSPELERYAQHLKERLSRLASHPHAAFDALWARLDQLGMRMVGPNTSLASQHRLSRDDLRKILADAGSLISPPLDIAAVTTGFAATSRIGRSWQTDIAGERLTNLMVAEILTALDEGKRSILLTGLPGCGKTCTLLEVQENLEQRFQSRRDIVPLFIQTREFADFVTAQDRAAQGLPNDWVEQVARLADEIPVVVIMDSLDVLSIAREHSALKYFLAQMDRLLGIPRVAVLTACREFDRHYDRQLSVRKWDQEFSCPSLSWEKEILPLLCRLKIHVETIDATTRQLITNPRELALFVELAHKDGSFNVVTSQALAERYLKRMIRDDPDLGDEALRAIEYMAQEMLNRRCLTVPETRCRAETTVLRRLQSLNVLRQSHNGDLTFGHQTLLDVLVIQHAIRHGMSFKTFIDSLSPVPFVRPSIRSFITQLALGERRNLRQQIRPILFGGYPYHIRRLVAECLAELTPENEDWPLINEARRNHPDIFQILLAQGKTLPWYFFWQRHLLPVLKNQQDQESMTNYLHRISQWLNDQPISIIQLWRESLNIPWLEQQRLSGQFPFYLNDLSNDHLALAKDLVEKLLQLPKPDHSYLGSILARCVEREIIDDQKLWDFITRDISDEDGYIYGFGNKLHCDLRELGRGSDDFLKQRMAQSEGLLLLAIETVETWCTRYKSRFNVNNEDKVSLFLRHTSYQKTHSQADILPVDGAWILFHALEYAVLEHAKKDSDWWRIYRERLAFNKESALVYVTVIACTQQPVTNLDLIGRMLCDSKLLQSELRYELGNLLEAAFIQLSPDIQDQATDCILELWMTEQDSEYKQYWSHTEQAKLLSIIPCHLRTSAAQASLEDWQRQYGLVHRAPDIGLRSGMVHAPFGFQKLLDSTDATIVALQSHYIGIERSEFLVGGEGEVARQLSQAASRAPLRFIFFLKNYWREIGEKFRDAILEGAANYLAYRHGNLRPDSGWSPLQTLNDFELVQIILDELEQHPAYWKHKRASADALLACANVIATKELGAKLCFLAIDFANLNEPHPIHSDSINYLSQGINMRKGRVAEALMIVANEFAEKNIETPDILLPALMHFSHLGDPAIAAVMLQHLPYFQSFQPDMGWQIFEGCMSHPTGLWGMAERCLYYSYHQNFHRVAPWLAYLKNQGQGEDLEVWGRISALVALDNPNAFNRLLLDLAQLSSVPAWKGAASVWTNNSNLASHQAMCLDGIEAALNGPAQRTSVAAKEFINIFRHEEEKIPLPIKLIQQALSCIKSDPEFNRHSIWGLDSWLHYFAESDPEFSLEVAEIYLEFLKSGEHYYYDHDNNMTSLLTRLFAAAEEQEQQDSGSMLRRVVALQDQLLVIGGQKVNDWLQAAERP